MSGNFGQQQFQRQQFKHKPSDMAKAEIDHDAIRARLKVPARGLMISGLLSVLLLIGGTVGGLVYGSTQKEQIVRDLTIRLFGVDDAEQPRGRRQRKDTKKEEEAKQVRENRSNTVMTLVLGSTIIGALILCSFYIFAVSGGVLMGQLRNYRVCKLACILALIPVISPLIVVGIPFGVIGLAKLKSAEVKKAFT